MNRDRNPGNLAIRPPHQTTLLPTAPSTPNGVGEEMQMMFDFDQGEGQQLDSNSNPMGDLDGRMDLLEDLFSIPSSFGTMPALPPPPPPPPPPQAADTNSSSTKPNSRLFSAGEMSALNSFLVLPEDTTERSGSGRGSPFANIFPSRGKWDFRPDLPSVFVSLSQEFGRASTSSSNALAQGIPANSVFGYEGSSRSSSRKGKEREYNRGGSVNDTAGLRGNESSASSTNTSATTPQTSIYSMDGHSAEKIGEGSWKDLEGMSISPREHQQHLDELHQQPHPQIRRRKDSSASDTSSSKTSRHQQQPPLGSRPSARTSSKKSKGNTKAGQANKNARNEYPTNQPITKKPRRSPSDSTSSASLNTSSTPIPSRTSSTILLNPHNNSSDAKTQQQIPAVATVKREERDSSVLSAAADSPAPEPIRTIDADEEEEMEPDDGGEEVKPTTGAGRGGSGTSGRLLTSKEKRANHILSEQKRRNAIRLGYVELSELLSHPLNQPPPTFDPTASSSAAGSNRPRLSKSSVLNKAVSMMKWLEEGNNWIESEVGRLEDLLLEQ